MQCVGVDGESIDGVYVLLAAANDEGWSRYVERPEGLSTAECLTFLCQLPAKARCFWFAGGYDVNMLLGDLPERVIERLYLNGVCYWRQFTIQYRGKCLQVTRYDRYGAKGRKRLDGVTVWDVFPWVQTSFVKWIDSWKLAPKREVERIQRMKLKRSTFAESERVAIRDYCIAECRYLAAGVRELMHRVDDSGLKVRQFYSPASLAKARMKELHTTSHMADPPARLVRAVDEAFLGGRAEVAQFGPIDGPLYQYDINSAYPHHATNLPCLAHGRWRRTKTVKPLSLVRVSWRPKRGHRHPVWGGLPIRPRVGSNRWPTHGTAWRWGVEVIAARRHCTVDVKECWTFTPGCDHRPFDYMHAVYDERRAMKAAGNPVEFVLKLELNATYGALAEHPHRPDQVPRYRCLAWAGLITAGARAQILDALTDDVVLIATDSLISRSPLPIPVGDRLGEWKHEATYDEAWIAATGIYYGSVDGVWSQNKTRGFSQGQLDRERFVEAWAADGRDASVVVQRDRFIGMGTALHRVHGFRPPHSRLWRQFVTERTVKRLDPAPRRVWVSGDRWDGRTRAPALAESRAIERADRARLARLHDQYDNLVTLHLILERAATRRGQAVVQARLDECDRMMLWVAAEIASHADGVSPMFDETDDPDGA